ncbi:MAG: single-stranded DNA-binding protein [Chitinophagaceae bacterium]|nr:MAG: single-stranded DNA-binding protein [Chitinophagaceae bacterium]
MEITGRLTANAQVTEIKDGRKVVNFDVAVNDYYKTKTGEAKTVTAFYRCAYWISPHVARLLTKGTLVSLYGRTGVEAYMGKDGEPRASLKFHTSQIKILSSAHNQENSNIPEPERQENNTVNLPF